jgi:oligopeptidase B
MARIEPKRLEIHGHARTDDYYWLNQRENAEVIAYLEAENAYTASTMAAVRGLENELFEEIKGRIKQSDQSAPVRERDHYYYTRVEEGREYPIHCRKRGSLDAPEQVLLDVNRLAEGHGYYAVGRRAISSGQDLLAYAEDTVGRRIYTVRFKNLTSGEMLTDTIPEVTPNLVWAEDNRTLFYARQDPETLRSCRIYRHELGTDPAQDALVYEESDETFSAYVDKTRSRQYLIIASIQTLSTEYRYLRADDPRGTFRVLEPRRRGHEYFADHLGGHFYLKTNHEARNFRLMRAPVERTTLEHWTEVVPHREDVLLESFELFRDYLVLEERENALVKLQVRPWSGEPAHWVDFGEPAYEAAIGVNSELDTTLLRYKYESMTTPISDVDYDMARREKTIVKEEEVLGGFDKADYLTERLWAPARDGTGVPISLVYRKGLPRDGSRPALLYGYGAYGASMEAGFASHRLSLVDRGFVYAIAHVRGGEELGRRWYEDGRQLKKQNTFTDFIDCAGFLIAEGYTRADRLFAHGGSAGGLLVGAVLNMRPDLFRGAVADVLFVDVVTTMLDDSIPLTTVEYDEWGNPGDKQFYDYMLSYSPYDNVRAQAYPHLLVTTSLHDSQVQYFEPAKWVARLRALKTDDNRLLLETKMEAGHGGVSGRYRRYRQLARRYAFMLDVAGIRG